VIGAVALGMVVACPVVLMSVGAPRRVRAASVSWSTTAHNLKPRQFQILGVLHDRGALAQRELP
jgi:hypothetical protein